MKHFPGFCLDTRRMPLIAHVPAAAPGMELGSIAQGWYIAHVRNLVNQQSTVCISQNANIPDLAPVVGNMQTVSGVLINALFPALVYIPGGSGKLWFARASVGQCELELQPAMRIDERDCP